MGVNAFTVTGNTVTLTADTTPPTPVQCVSTTLGGNQYRIINTSTTVTAYLSFAATATDATTNCIIPTVSASSRVLPILPATDEIITFVPNAYFTANTASSTATLFITPGDGL